MGTGTTLLRLVLDSHDRIAIPPETGFMRAYNAHRFIPFKWSGRNWAKRMGWSDRELDEQLRAFYDTIFMRYASAHGKVRWGEKTPLHTWHVDDMARLFPDAVFVGIVRHPGGSVASNMNRWELSLRRALGHCERYTREMTRQAARHPDRFVVLRYEDLVLEPERVLGELLDWLGEPWSDTLLEHHVVQGARDAVRIEGRNRADEPIDTTRITKWTKTLDDEARAELRERLGRLGELYGYAMDDPGALAPLTARGGALMGGHEVGARIDEFADLDLRTQGDVPRLERLYHPRDYELVAVGAEDGDQTVGGHLRAAAQLTRRRMVPLGVRRAIVSATRRRTG